MCFGLQLTQTLARPLSRDAIRPAWTNFVPGLGSPLDRYKRNGTMSTG